MEFISNWITNIILFVLLAIVIELLLPNTKMQKYVKLVIGLILIVILLTPVLALFKQDVNEIVKKLDNSQETGINDMKNLIDYKKREIQASQHAYILEQMAVQMKDNAAAEFKEKFGYEIQEVRIFSNEEEETQDQIEKIEVVISQKAKDNEVVHVQTVIIDTSVQPDYSKGKNFKEKEMETYFAKKWEVAKHMIHIRMEGGPM